jgi:Flp pilus assembly protein TadG
MILFGFQKFRGAEEPAGICKDRRGSVSVLAALTLPILVALAALVVDCGFALSQRAALQQAADSAALAGAMAYTSTTSTTATTATISDVVMANGWLSTAVIDPSGYLASANAVQVTLKATSPLWFGAAIVSGGNLNLTVYSRANLGGPTTCIISLSNTLTFNVVVHAETCNVASNSTGVRDNKALYAAKLYTLNSPADISNPSNIHATMVNGTINDPYTAQRTALNTGLDNCPQPLTYLGTSALSPGCWNSPIFIKPVTLSSGVYYMVGGFKAQAGGSVTGTDSVTVVSDVGLALDGNITLTAPTSGSYAGIALYLKTGGIDFNNGVSYNIDGAIYAPDSAGGGLTFDTSTWNAGACTYLVAAWITFNSGATFTLPQGGCTGGSVSLAK